MNRREFLGWVGIGTLASSLPVAIAACSPETPSTQTPTPATPTTANSPTPPAATSAGDREFQAIGTVAQLDKDGKILNKDFAGGPVLVVRNPADPKTLLAVNPTCPHKACRVEWEADDKEFDCPCHGSDFAPDGKVLKGPATQALKTYQVKIEGDSVLVKAS